MTLEIACSKAVLVEHQKEELPEIPSSVGGCIHPPGADCNQINSSIKRYTHFGTTDYNRILEVLQETVKYWDRKNCPR